MEIHILNEKTILALRNILHDNNFVEVVIVNNNIMKIKSADFKTVAEVVISNVNIWFDYNTARCSFKVNGMYVHTEITYKDVTVTQDTI